MITLKPVLKGKLHSLAFMVCVMLTLCVFLGGCSSMPKQTEQDKIDIILELYLPEGTSVEFYTQYDLHILLDERADGETWCNDWAVREKCAIKVIRNAEVLLHEICHVLEHGFHGAYKHHGLYGCEAFNYDTLARL